MNIVTNDILDLEDRWKQKALDDVKIFHKLKKQEMTNALEEEEEFCVFLTWGKRVFKKYVVSNTESSQIFVRCFSIKERK